MPSHIHTVHILHGSAMEGYYPHELILGYEICQMKGTIIEVSELTLKNPINLAF